MNLVGIDLPQTTTSLCVVEQRRAVQDRRPLHGCRSNRTRALFEGLGPQQAVVEADRSVLHRHEEAAPMGARIDAPPLWRGRSR